MIRLLVVLLLVSSSVISQVRIDSSFAFSTNPAKKYSIYVPSGYNSSMANVLMVGFHPFNPGTWDAQTWCDTLLNFCESNDILLVCPDGGPLGDITDPIDYAFTEALMDSMKVWYNVDTNRTYTFGFSMGGKAVYEFGLSHADRFGGFMSLGPAVPTIANIDHNAGGRPFYLLNGSLDSPAIRFYPLLTNLWANCALVDSFLMPGIGHTITFPNRDQILTSAYKWIDSVNVTPRSGSFSLVSPISFTSLDIKGFNDFPHNFTWKHSSLADNCGVMKYEIMFDLPSNGFANPLLKVSSNNLGIDTVFTVSNHNADSALASVGVPFNVPTTLEWTVRSILPGNNSDTAKEFSIIITRKDLGFKLLNPASNKYLTLENGSSEFFNWQDLDHYFSVAYNLDFDSLTGDFSNPLMSYLTPNNGTNSNYNIGHSTLYYDLMFSGNHQMGDTILLKWTASAEDTVYKEFASSERNIYLIRGDVGFSLIYPQDNSLIQSKSGQDYTFTWDSVPRSNVTYEWLFDTLGVDLFNSANVVLPSGNNGFSSRIPMTYEVLDSILVSYNLDYLDTLHGQWTSRGIHSGGVENSIRIYKIDILRAHPVGIDMEKSTSDILIYPNPVKNDVNISWDKDLIVSLIEIIDASGKIVNVERIDSNEKSQSVDLSDFDTGIYLLNLHSDRGIYRSTVVKH